MVQVLSGKNMMLLMISMVPGQSSQAILMAMMTLTYSVLLLLNGQLPGGRILMDPEIAGLNTR